MSELRDDVLTGARVIVAPGRSARPTTFRQEAPVLPSALATCPFCYGNEHETPPEVARIGPGAPDTPGWEVRVFPNLYPLVGSGVPGAHEVVVLSPAHDHSFADLDKDQATDVLTVLRDRAAFHLMHGCTHAQLLINHGKAAGASIEHPHAQLVAVQFVPPFVDHVLDRFATAGHDLTAAARDDGHIVDDGPVTVWCPSASLITYHVRLAMDDSGPRFDLAPDADVAALATALRDTLRALREVVGDVPYNVVVNSAPRDDPRPYHWWVDIWPRISIVAGFEMATGLYVCSVDPADAAAALRNPS